VYFLKGLEDVIGVSIVHPTWNQTQPKVDEHCGWIFRKSNDPPVTSSQGHGSFPCGGCVPDTVNHCNTIRELYDKVPSESGEDKNKRTFSVPVLWDKKHKTIVSNESSEIIQMLNSEFNAWAKNPNLDLNPAHLKEEMESADSWIYPNINNGVYRCGFAKTQDAYHQAFVVLFDSLDRLDDLLSKRRYICGDILTLSDIRAFTTLIRFDEVYVVYFKTNKKMIRYCYPNLFNYVKSIYQIPGVSNSINMDHIKMHYYTSHTILNSFSIIPIGNPDDWSSAHDRDRFSK